MAEQKLNINQLDNEVLTETEHATTDHTGLPGIGAGGGGTTDTVAGNNGITNVGDNINAILEPTYGTTANTITQGNDSRLPTTDEKAAIANAPTAPNAGNPFLTAADGVGAGINTEDEGVPVGTATTLDFVGLGVTATNSVGKTTVTVSGGVIATEDEGSPLGATDTIDFVGAGITATHLSGKTTVTVPAGTVSTEDEGTPIGSASSLDFVGAGVSAAFASGKTTVTIAGGGGGSTSFDAVVDPAGSADFTTISAAITAGAKLIRVMAGIYNETVTLLPGVYLFGPNGQGATAQDALITQQVNMVSNTGFQNMSCDQGLSFAGGSDSIKILDSYIDKGGLFNTIIQTGVGTLTNIHIIRNIIKSSKIGIILTPTVDFTNVHITDNTISGFDTSAIDISFTGIPSAAGLEVRGNSLDGTSISAGTKRGINILSKKTIIEGNSFVGNSLDSVGIGLGGSGGVITNNIITLSGRGLVVDSVNGTSDISVSNNHISGGAVTGMEINGNRTAITGNTVEGNTVNGIEIRVGATNCLVVGNITLNNGTNNLLDSGTTTLAANNIII